MFNKDLILYYLEKKGWSKYKLCKEANLAQSTLSDILTGKNVNPRMDTIQKIADALNVNVFEFFDEGFPATKKDINNWNKSLNTYQPNYVDEDGTICKFKKKDNSVYKLYADGKFDSAEAAMQFILSQPSIMAYGGFDIKKLSDQDKIDFANDLLSQLKLLGLKYNK